MSAYTIDPQDSLHVLMDGEFFCEASKPSHAQRIAAALNERAQLVDFLDWVSANVIANGDGRVSVYKGQEFRERLAKALAAAGVGND